MLRTPKRRGTRRVLTAVPILAVAFAVTNLTSAAFATIVSTTTTLSAPATAAVGQSVTLTATSTPTGLLAGAATISGTVTYKSGGTTVGTSTFSGCAAGKACTTHLDTTALPQGQDSLTAVYSGGGLAAGSTSKAVVINVLPIATPANPDTVNCTGSTCNGTQVYSADLSSGLNVTTTGGSGNYTLTESLGGTALSCSTHAAIDGQPGNLSIEGDGGASAATISYQLLGSYATSYNTTYGSLNKIQICFGSPNQFLNSHQANGEWEGLLPACTTHTAHSPNLNKPCVSAQVFSATGGPTGQAQETITIQALPNNCGDPTSDGDCDNGGHPNADPRPGGG